MIISNPITSQFLDSLNSTSQKLNLAAPFMSDFIKQILPKDVASIKDKRIVTKLDESYLYTFHLDAFSYLLELGFEIRYNNDIHLKMYLMDDEGFISSSNLTKAGFEDQVELTSTINSSSIPKCYSFFEELWNGSEAFDPEILDEKYPVFLLLKNKENFKKLRKKKDKPELVVLKNKDFSLEGFISELISDDHHWRFRKKHTKSAEQDRIGFTKKILTNGFKTEYFYSLIDGHLDRSCLHYIFAHASESHIAGTGLNADQYKAVFTDPKFEEAVSYIYPPIIGEPQWNLEDDDTFLEFAHGIFQFDIKNYKEVMPIRLASYFYPSHILPIFKLDHLKNVASVFGYEPKAKTTGEKLYQYNKIITDELKLYTRDRYDQSDIFYHLMFGKNLLASIENGKTLSDVTKNSKQRWIKDYTKKAYDILLKLGSIEDKSL